MTAATSADEEVLVSVAETLGAAAGKVVSAARQGAATLAHQTKKLERRASTAGAKAKSVLKKTKRRTAKLAKSAKRSANSARKSAKRSVKKAARKLKR
jgi:hypothetical protein